MVAGIGAAALLSLARSASRRYDLENKVVLITGGSRGLGLVLAREFATYGSKIAICARDRDELARAREDLESRGVEVFDLICDVGHQEQVERAVADVKARFGPVDVLVNDAGIINVGPIETQTQKDFEEAMRIHFWGPFYMMKAVLTDMRARQTGRIANISSIGGKIAVPHLTPYCASKFALAGMSSGMSAELAKDNIRITTVYPGLMRTGSHINARFKGQNQTEYALFSIMDASPLFSVSAESAARQIVRAIRRGDSELIISPQAKLAAKFNHLFPELTHDILAFTNRLLPGPGGIGTHDLSGKLSTSAAAPSILTALADAASPRNNELRPNESI
jgi:NAD(P)-dependent dehydrogenase (short-subunit alcohol dehydrogenase family)